MDKKRFNVLVDIIFTLLLGGIVSVSALPQAAAQASCVPPPPGMIAWWPGNGNADDIVGSNHGTLQNGATFAPGLVDQAFSFDDAFQQFVRVPHSPSLDIQDALTIDAWVMKKGDCEPLNCWLVAKGNQDFSYDTENGRYGIFIADAYYWSDEENGRVALSFNTGRWEDVVMGTTILLDNTWYHVAGTWDGTTAKIYVNGLLENSVPKTGTILTSSDQGSLAIGAQIFGGEFFNGFIDEVEIFDRALSASEIQAIFNAGSAGKCKVTTTITIDIKPGSFPNSINPQSKGKIPVAILTTTTFDATTVDPTTVFLGPTGTEAALVHSAFEDVDGDGDTDMIVHFNTQDTGIECGNISASLTGQTWGGQRIKGSDAIRTVRCK